MSDTVPSDRTVLGDSLSPEDRFASAWQEGNAPPLTEFLPQEGDEGYLATLERLVQIEIEQSWRRWNRQPQNRPRPLEDHLHRFPVLRTPDAILRLGRAEFVIRSQAGDEPDPKSYCDRFPDYFSADSAAELLTAARDSAAAPSTTSPPGELGMLGDYQLLEQIGEGGMGVVYRALQPGAQRIVALKVIRSAMTGAGESFRRKAESRFKNEIHAAAQLEHENIVPVYDVGSVGDLMYFAMRFVDGQSLSDLVKSGPLENRAAATYMAGTARGVAEAHRRGILHRDLKPHNVMIDSRSGRPLVADFGLAKLVDADDQITKTGEAIGTPSYMPPEQISDAARVDERGDVYSLGATLYHLLAGRPPFQAANTLGTMRQVLYDEAAPPRRLNSAVDADLDTICLKCLQKEPGRRYQSVGELADDLERYLRGEPILARPIGRLERLNRWRRRNPVEAGLTAAAIVLAGTALAATTIGYRNTNAALAEARQNLAFARSAVDELYTEVSEIDLENQPGLQPLKRKLLARALNYYQRFLEANRGDAELSTELADSYFRVGTITEEIESVAAALPHFEQGADIQRTLLERRVDDAALQAGLADSLNSIGRIQQRLQNYTAAQAAYDESRALRERLAGSAPGNRDYQRKLANVVMNGGLLKFRRQEFDAAAAAYAAAQQLREPLLEDSENDAVVRDYARGAFNQGTLEQAREQDDAAALHLGEAINRFQQLAARHPESLSDRFELAVALALSGDVAARQGRAADALSSYRAARAVLEVLAKENPRVLAYHERLGTAAIGEAHLRMNLAVEALDRQPPDDVTGESELRAAEELLRAGAGALRTVLDTEPDRVGPRHELAETCQLLGDIHQLQQNDDDARAAWNEGLKTLAPLKETFDRNADCARTWKTLEESLQSLPATLQ